MAVSDVINLSLASISDLQRALDSGSITSVELVALYLHRIAKYDMRGPVLNSIPVINSQVLEEAQASDDYRASGKPLRPLEGIPFTVKDSFKVKGMTVAAGSPAFSSLVASEDAFIVKLLREAGAIVLGRTNMPPMADGGCQRGLYDRSESPYNTDYLTTGYASGSSNGSGTSTAAAFAAFGFAGETVSSGRAPASNNALVGYSPSRGFIPIRGQWPLYPTCDVVVPHTRSMSDLFAVLNVIVADDPKGDQGCDFWRSQEYVSIPKASAIRPINFLNLKNSGALRGKRVAVPSCFLNLEDAEPRTVCITSVRELFECARKDMEALGATIVQTDFPMFEQYTKKDFPGQGANVPGMSNKWANIERCQLIATSWDHFLRVNGDAKCPNLTHADPSMINPHVSPLDDPSAYYEAQNQVRYPEMIDLVRARETDPHALPGCAEAVRALERMRKIFYEDWMDANGYDLLVFPTNGDVAFADSDEKMESMVHALQDGVKYSNGGRALKHLGIPCITVPMGQMEDKGMPVGITLAGKAWKDQDLLQCAYAYEAASKKRTSPPLTPPLTTDQIIMKGTHQIESLRTNRPIITIDSVACDKEDSKSEHIRQVHISGTVQLMESLEVSSLTAYIDGEPVGGLEVAGNTWSIRNRLTRSIRHDKYPTRVKLPRDHSMFMIVLKTSNGRSAAQFIFID